ncbi:MAG: NUDIX domain-containing protein [Cyanobacteria bacterium]|nr:NUDIX domain-containing protein [Cyanobacteriota bacterium]
MLTSATLTTSGLTPSGLKPSAHFLGKAGANSAGNLSGILTPSHEGPLDERLAGTSHLELRVNRQHGIPWAYAHRPNAKGVVCIFPVIQHEGKRSLLFLLSARPPLNRPPTLGKLNIECPAGLAGDEHPEESMAEAAARELKEETGVSLSHHKLQLLADNVTASAGLTSESKSYFLADNVSLPAKHTPVGDGRVIIDRLLVPISRLEKDLSGWLQEQYKANRVISSDTLAGLSLVLAQEKYRKAHPVKHRLTQWVRGFRQWITQLLERVFSVFKTKSA